MWGRRCSESRKAASTKPARRGYGRPTGVRQQGTLTRIPPEPSTRLGREPTTPSSVAKLLKKQHGRCAECGLYFRSDDRLEMDHVHPRAQGGTGARKNLQLLHRQDPPQQFACKHPHRMPTSPGAGLVSSAATKRQGFQRFTVLAANPNRPGPSSPEPVALPGALPDGL